MKPNSKWPGPSRVGVVFGIILGAGIVVAACSTTEPQEEAVSQPTEQEMQDATNLAPSVPLGVSVNALMVALVDHASHEIWDVVENHPESDADWGQLEYHAIQLTTAGTLISMRGTGPADAEQVKDAGQRAIGKPFGAGALANCKALVTPSSRPVKPATRSSTLICRRKGWYTPRTIRTDEYSTLCAACPRATSRGRLWRVRTRALEESQHSALTRRRQSSRRRVRCPSPTKNAIPPHQPTGDGQDGRYEPDECPDRHRRGIAEPSIAPRNTPAAKSAEMQVSEPIQHPVAHSLHWVRHIERFDVIDESPRRSSGTTSRFP